MNNPPVSRRPLALAIALALCAGSTHAATVIVTSIDDNSTAGDGLCTLREAIAVIEASDVSTSGCAASGTFGTNDKILFSTATPANATVTLSMGTLQANSLTAPLTIFGGGVTIDANKAPHVLEVHSATLQLDDFVLTGASSSSVAGGAIFAYKSHLTVNSSTISNNYNFAAGGVALVYNSTLTMNQCTVTGNSSYVAAAAVFAAGSTVLLNNSTVSGNTNTGSQGTGGIAIQDDSYNQYSAYLRLQNSILSGNSGPLPDLYNNTATVAASHSLLGTSLSTAYTGNGNVFSDDPMLGSLDDNGGLTRTMALLSGSPAIDAGDNTLIPGGAAYDQRGYPYTRVINGIVDIGAFEFNDKIFADGFDPP